MGGFTYYLKNDIPHIIRVIFFEVPERYPFRVGFNVTLKFIFEIVVLGSPCCMGEGGLTFLFFLEKNREVVTYC